MDRPRTSPRLVQLLKTAQSNPQFGARLLAELPPRAREAAVAELAKPAPEIPQARPGLRKCGKAPAYGSHSGYSAGLNAFARGVSRIA